MARTVGLDAVVRPDVDQRAAKTAASDLSDTLDPAGELEPRFSGARRAARKLGDTIESALPALPGGQLLGGLTSRLKRSSGGKAGAGGTTPMSKSRGRDSKIQTAQLATQRSILKQLKKQGFSEASDGKGGGGMLSMLLGGGALAAGGAAGVGLAGLIGLHQGGMSKLTPEQRQQTVDPQQANRASDTTWESSTEAKSIPELTDEWASSLPSLSDALEVDSVDALASLLGMEQLGSLTDMLGVGELPTLESSLGVAGIPSLDSLLGFEGVPTIRELLGLGQAPGDRASAGANAAGGQVAGAGGRALGGGGTATIQEAIAREIGAAAQEAFDDFAAEFNLDVVNEVDLSFDPSELEREISTVVGDVEREVDDLKRRITRGGGR